MPDQSSIKYRALDMLHRSHAPKLSGRPPFWRPKAPECTPRVQVPSWAWHRPLTSDDGQFLTILDANGAYLSAAASVEVAHGTLVHTGGIQFDRSLPGYWLVMAHPWPCWDRIMSPLGGRPGARRGSTGSAVWLTTPTVRLLEQLVDHGQWPDVEVLDSWTDERSIRLRTWASAIRRDREAVHVRTCPTPNRDATCCAPHAQEARIKEGYATAVVMLGQQHTKSPIYRPDWMNAIRAQSAASIWRKAWGGLMQGYALVAAGHVDELVYPRRQAIELWSKARAGLPVPVRIDTSGIALGGFKVKAGSVPAEEWEGRG